MSNWTKDDLKAVIASNPNIRILDNALTAQAKQQAAAKRQKFNARTCYQDGYKFDSGVERERYLQLVALQKAGEIRQLLLHPTYVVFDAFTHMNERIPAMTYTPDFEYLQSGIRVIEDVKSEETEKKTDFRMRIKLFKARYQHIKVVIMVFDRNHNMYEKVGRRLKKAA